MQVRTLLSIHTLGVTGYDIDCYRVDLGKVVGALYEIVYTSKTIMCVVPLRKEESMNRVELCYIIYYNTEGFSPST